MQLHKKILAWLLCFLLPASAVQAGSYANPGQFIGYKTLITFWSGDCANCNRQLPILIKTARFNPDIKFYYVFLGSMSSDDEVRDALPSNLLIRSVSEVGSSLRSFGATASMLPFSAYMRADGTVCRSRAGVQGTGTLEDWIEKC